MGLEPEVLVQPIPMMVQILQAFLIQVDLLRYVVQQKKNRTTHISTSAKKEPQFSNQILQSQEVQISVR